MSIVSWHTPPDLSFYSPWSAKQNPEALSRTSRPIAPQSKHSKQSKHSATPTSFSSRLSSLKSKARSLGPHQQGGDVGNYTGFDVYEAQQREAHKRRLSDESTTSTDTDLTLVETDETLPAYSKDGYSCQTEKDSKLITLGKKLSPVTSSNRLSRNQIPETPDEKLSRKAAKKEKKKRDRKTKWFGLVDDEDEDFGLDHKGQECGWACSRHHYLMSRGSMDWTCVAGMYM